MGIDDNTNASLIIVNRRRLSTLRAFDEFICFWFLFTGSSRPVLERTDRRANDVLCSVSPVDARAATTTWQVITGIFVFFVLTNSNFFNIFLSQILRALSIRIKGPCSACLMQIGVRSEKVGSFAVAVRAYSLAWFRFFVLVLGKADKWGGKLQFENYFFKLKINIETQILNLLSK